MLQSSSLELNRLSIDNGSEDLSILYGFLSWTIDVVGGSSYFNWVHGGFFECLDEGFHVLQLLDILNIYNNSLSTNSAEVKSHLLAIIMEVDLGDSVAHELPAGKGIVYAEEGLYESVHSTHWGDHVPHVYTEQAKSGFDACLFDFPWNELLL